MLGKYYYGEIVRCVKSGYNVTISENGEKDVKFTYPILRDLRGAILRKEKGYYVDIRYNKVYEKVIYSFAEKGKYYVTDIKPIKKAMKNLSLKDKLQLFKFVILTVTNDKLNKIDNKEKKKTYNKIR